MYLSGNSYASTLCQCDPQTLRTAAAAAAAARSRLKAMNASFAGSYTCSYARFEIPDADATETSAGGGGTHAPAHTRLQPLKSTVATLAAGQRRWPPPLSRSHLTEECFQDAAASEGRPAAQDRDRRHSPGTPGQRLTAAGAALGPPPELHWGAAAAYPVRAAAAVAADRRLETATRRGPAAAAPNRDGAPGVQAAAAPGPGGTRAFD